MNFFQGWICISRTIQNHWIWKDKEPFDKRSAWIDLLMDVNHESNKVAFEKDFIEIERGQTLTSIKQLSERWKWSRHKVSDFLNKLEKDSMIVQVRDTKRTLISIINYDKYQFQHIKWDMSSDIVKGHVTDINNNDNNIYYILLNKYKGELQNKNFTEKIKIISDMQKTNEYCSLTGEEQNDLYADLMGRKDI